MDVLARSAVAQMHFAQLVQMIYHVAASKHEEAAEHTTAMVCYGFNR